MSKKMSEVELISHCSNAVNGLRDMLEEFAHSTSSKVTKRAMLISYWLKTYTDYIRKEDKFSPESVFRLKRGTIVRVEFGYRIGRELGGRHYAAVLDVNNGIHRNTVTVVPLGSLKEHSDKDKYTVVLDDGVYGPVKRKLDAVIADAEKTGNEATEMSEKISVAEEQDKAVLRAVQRQKAETTQRLIKQANIWLEEISHMQEGSVAKVDQITTISKMRISQPLQKTHPLYGIRLTATDMDKIDEKLKQFYFPKRV